MQRIFEAFFEQAAVGMCHVALDGTLARVNRRFTEIFGRPTEDLVGRSIDTLIHPDDRVAFRAQIRALVAGEIPQLTIETRVSTAGGDTAWLRFRLFVLSTGDEAGTGELCGIAEDIAREKQRETLMETAASMSHLGSFERDLATNESQLSDEMFRIYGFEPKSFQPNRERFLAAQHPDDLPAVLEALRVAEGNSTLTPVRVEHRIVRPGGEVRWLASTVAILSGAGGTPERAIGASLDITERKLAEEALRRSEHDYRELMELAADAILVVDRDSRCVDVNRAAYEMLGYSREELLGLSIADIVDERDLENQPLRLDELQSGTPLRTDRVLRRKDGTVVQTELNARMLPNGRMQAIVRDVTERHRALQMLQERERQLVDAQRLAKLGSWELDLITSRLWWSDEIYRIFEIDRAQFGASYEAFLATVHPDDRELVNETYQRSVQNRTPYGVEHRLRTPDGRVKHVVEQGWTTYAEDGAPLRSTGTVQDITDRKLAEQRIADSLREKETLLREMHHRVKNNLQVISSLLHFQGKKVKDPDALAVLDEGRDRLRSMILVHEKLYRSGDLVNVDFGDYARTLVNELRQSHTSHTGSRTGKLRVDIDVESVFLPIETALPCGMILSELTSNSFKHAFADRPTGRLRIEATRTDRSLSLVVEDDGVGMPAAASIESPASFGLQLVRNLVGQLGATIDIDGSAGTRFRITVPLHAAPRSVA